MGMANHKHNFGETIDAQGSYTGELMKVCHFHIDNAPLASTTGVHAAVTDTGAQQVVTTGITSPTVARNITATAGGTAGDIKAIQVVIAGTNMADEAITETLPAFTENTAGTVTGSKAFKTVTSITIPAHDGTGATTAIGFGAKLGLPYKLYSTGQILDAVFAGSAETLAAKTVSSSAVESNTVTTTTALDGAKDLELIILVK